jgi:UDP-N-acetylmuramate: L-alanyl-gamma-D-glutamyl-meso-diaminopimelate ligase
MKIHFIAIGGSAMHNLAIALHLKGYDVSGSDDEVFEPSRSRLAKHGLLPQKLNWNPKKITPDLDAVILGMHARQDNPELARAKELNLTIYSYPEFLYEQSKDKTRIVIGGSHGKTTITAMILHVFQYHNINTDYMVGAQLDGFDIMVKLTDDAPIIVLEGDEYLSSAMDRRPKFHLYKPHIALLSGIAWDHINVFPTFDFYLEQFRNFIKVIEKDGKLIYCAEDKELSKLCNEEVRADICRYPYHTPPHEINNGITSLEKDGVIYPLKVFGEHNLQNIAGAMEVCRQVGVTDNMFLAAIANFKGASNRLQLLAQSDSNIVFKDFAHAPSKLKATTQAVKKQFPERKLIAIMELHTYSSLNQSFLSQYKNTMALADIAFVYFNPHALALKKLPDISIQEIMDSFGGNNLEVINSVELLQDKILEQKRPGSTYIFMSSGSFGNLNLNWLAEELTEN